MAQPVNKLRRRQKRKDAALARVRVVCAGDFQNAISAIFEKILSGESLEAVKADARENRFWAIPPDTPLEQVKAALEWAHSRKGSRPYAEARLFGAVLESELTRVNGNS